MNCKELIRTIPSYETSLYSHFLIARKLELVITIFEVIFLLLTFQLVSWIFPYNDIVTPPPASDVTVFTVTKGPKFTTSIHKQDAELTKEMIESGQWKTKTFKPFNFRAKVCSNFVWFSWLFSNNNMYGMLAPKCLSILLIKMHTNWYAYSSNDCC